MNKKGNINKSMQIALGTTLGILGLILATSGAISEQIVLMRTGAVIITIGVWIIQWN